MKIRLGFVSNSSSSSFLAFVRELHSAEDLRDVNRPLVLGEWIGEGKDVFEPDPAMIDYVCECRYNFQGYYEILYVLDSQYVNPKVLADKLLELKDYDKIEILSVEADYNSCFNLDMLKERYK